MTLLRAGVEPDTTDSLDGSAAAFVPATLRQAGSGASVEGVNTSYDVAQVRSTFRIAAAIVLLAAAWAEAGSSSGRSTVRLEVTLAKQRHVEGEPVLCSVRLFNAGEKSVRVPEAALGEALHLDVVLPDGSRKRCQSGQPTCGFASFGIELFAGEGVTWIHPLAYEFALGHEGTFRIRARYTVLPESLIGFQREELEHPSWNGTLEADGGEFEIVAAESDAERRVVALVGREDGVLDGSRINPKDAELPTTPGARWLAYQVALHSLPLLTADRLASLVERGDAGEFLALAQVDLAHTYVRMEDRDAATAMLAKVPDTPFTHDRRVRVERLLGGNPVGRGRVPGLPP